MASNWQETYEKLKKQKEMIDLLEGNGLVSLPTSSKKSSTSSKKTTTSSTKKDDEERKWFNTGLFDDGYQIGDITKTILGTSQDVNENLTKGVLRIGEGLIDTGAYLAGGVGKMFGADEFADKTSDFIKRNLIEEYKLDKKLSHMANPSGGLTSIANKILNNDQTQETSLFGDKSDSLIQSAGQLAGTFGLQAVGVPWWLTTGVTSFGGEAEQAFNQDATYLEAGISGVFSAGAEILTEKLSGGISFGGKTLDDTLLKPLTEKITSKVTRTLVNLGLDAAGEGFEEVLSEVISNVGKKLTYEDEKTWEEMLTSEEAMDSYIEAFIGGAVLGGGMSSYNAINSIKTGRDYKTGLTDNEQAVVDAEIAKRTEGQQLTSKQKAKIEAEVREDLERGYISTDTIESTLGGDTYNTLKSVRNNKTNLETQIKELENKPNAEITVAEMEQLNDLRERLGKINTTELESYLQSEMGTKIKSDGYLQRSYQEKAKRSQEFTYQATEKDSQFRKGVMESTKGKLNDTTRSHETAEALVKLSEDRKMQYKFTNNAELTKLGLVPEGKTANGLYVVDKDGSREILVNTDSKKYIEAVLVHETAHDFQTTSPDTYTKLQDITKEFAEAQNEYSKVYSEVAGMYKNVEGVNIEEEVTSRLLEDYLGNKDFINNLTTKEPNIVKKIIDEIKYLVKKFTAGSPEARKLVELQHNLEKTYKEAYKQTKATDAKEGTKYSLTEAIKTGDKKEIKDRLADAKKMFTVEAYNDIRKDVAKKYPDFFNKNTDDKGNKLSKGQQDYFKDSKARDEFDSLVTVYHTTTGVGTQFNEFNPVGTENYRFGDQVVNYYTNSKDMSGSYSSQKYNMADTKKLNSIEDAKKWLEDNRFNGVVQYDYELKKVGDDYNFKLYHYDSGYKFIDETLSENDLLKKTKEIVNSKVGINQRYQYEGYVNITNPYVVDAEGRYWNKVSEEYSQRVYDRYNSLNQIEKDYLMDLATWEDVRLFRTTMEDAHRDINIEHKKGMGEDVEALASAYKKLIGLDNLIDDVPANLYDVYMVASNDFSNEAMQEYATRTLTTNDIVHKIIAENKNGANYDGIIIKNVIDYGGHSANPSPNNVYVTFSSEQFKSYDNTNPTTDKDIRYSLSDKGTLVDSEGNDITLEASDTGTHGTLMAIHNLDESKLKGVIELGGFPVPSIAITDPNKISHNNFGGISVLFDKSTIDPANYKNEVFDRDVWSPTFPTVEYDIDTKVLNKIRKITNSDYGYDSSNKYLSSISSELNNIEDSVNRYGIERTFEKIKNSDAFKYVYLKQTNPDFKEAFKTEDYHPKYNNETLQRFLDKYDNKYPLNDMPSSEVDNYTSLMVEAYEEQVRQEYAKYPDLDAEQINSLVNTLTKSLRERFAQKDNFLVAAYKLQENGANNQIIDTDATNELINESINQQEYEKWVDETFKDIISAKGIRNDKDLFTPSGNRRSFKSLHEDYNLENIVKYLTNKSTIAGQEGWGAGSNFGTLQAQMSTKFKSIDEIKQYANERLVPTTEEHGLLQTYSDTIYADMEALSEYYKFDTSYYAESYDSAGYALNDFAKYKTQNLTNLKKALDNNNIVSEKVPTELLQKVVDDVNSLKNLPTDYFEAKPQRAVGLNEAQAIVIPNTTDAEFKQQLQDAGLKYYEYDPNIEGDRQRVINQFDDLKFSLSNESDIAPTSTRNQTAAQDIRLETEEIAPTKESPVMTGNRPVTSGQQPTTDINYAPASQEVAVEQGREAFNTLDDSDIPTEVEEIAPTSEKLTPTDSLFDTRDYEDVGNKKVNAYQYDNPEVRPYFQQAAREMLNDLQNTTKGERYIIGDASQLGDGDYYYSGTRRFTTDDIAELLDGMGGKYKYSYAEIRKGLNAIIEDNGAENNAVSKRIEFYLDKRLREGYTDIDGYKIPADEEYLDLMRAKGITDYYSSLPLGEAPVENVNKPVDNVSNSNIAERIAPIKAEAIRPAPTQDGDTHGYKLKRIKTDAEIQTETNEEIAKILTEEPKVENTRNKRKWAILKANVLDKGIVFEDVSLKHKNRELMGKWDYTLTSEARGQNVIGNGHYEYDPYSKTERQVSKSLNDIRAEVDNTGLTAEFYEYIYHKHNVDRMSLEGKYEGMENKPVFGYNVTAEQSQQVVNKYENQHPEFITFAQDIYDYLDADRQVLVDNGVISQETADLWKSMYPHYVPIRRAGQTGLNINVPLDTGRTGVNAPIKKATGGNQDILPLFDTMATRTLQTYRATAKNSFGVELKNTIGTTINSQATNIDEVIDSVDAQEELLQEGKNGQKPTFTVFEDGEKVTFEITQDMYDALKPLDNSSILSKTYGLPSNISGFHRGVLTQYNPVFMLTNAIKDAQDVLINSQHAAKTYAKVPEAFAQILKKGYWYQEYMNNGGEHNSYFDSIENTFKTENTGIKKVLDLPPLKQIAQMNDFVEKIPRLAEYIASREAGRSVEVSMLDAARVTTNFKAGGNLTKFLNRNGATFLNASVQGAMQQVRNIREANANGIRGWANLATKFAIAGLPAILLNALLWEDDEEYEELSDYVKQNYYIVAKTENGTFIRIPKGRTVAVIQEGVRQMQNLATGEDEADLKTFLDLFITNLAPNNPIESNILSPIVQVANNKTWYGEDLVPTRLQNLPTAEQYDESTDSFSRWLGQMTNISPMKINYLLDQYTGGIGDVVLPMLTPEAKSDADTLGEQMLAPLKSKFTTNATMNNQNVADFYETSEKLTTEAKKSNATDEDVLRNKYINSVKAEMNELYKEKREIQNSDLPNSEKYRRVLEVQKQINELSKEALNEYKNVDIYSNYATAGDRQYRLTDDGEWQKINDKQLEKQNEVTGSLGISPNDYWSNKEEYDYAYENPSKYALANAIAGYSTFRKISSELYDIKADKDESGKSISGSRKEKVFDYINNLDLDFEQRVMLAKSEYPSYDEYNNEIIEYLNNREDISYEQMVSILTELGFTVKKDGTISWD